MQSATNVSASKPAVGGALSRAPYGTSLPTNATAALNEAFASLGYISQDGMTNSNALSITDVKAWGGDTVLSTQDGKTDTFKTTLIEALSVDVLKTVFGSSNVSGDLTFGITVNVDASEQEYASWVFDMILKNGALKRVVIPYGKITAIEDITYADNSAIGYGITITASPDSNGKTHYEYIQNTVTGSVALDKSTASVAAGSSTTITATTTPAGGTVKWTSSDTDVATVTGGVVTGVAAGSCTVTARVPATGAAASCAVTVTSG